MASAKLSGEQMAKSFPTLGDFIDGHKFVVLAIRPVVGSPYQVAVTSRWLADASERITELLEVECEGVDADGDWVGEVWSGEYGGEYGDTISQLVAFSWPEGWENLTW